jgi:ankyrin repeat protein
MMKSQVADPWHTPRSIVSENVTLLDSSPFVKKSHLSVSSKTEQGFSKDESQARDYTPSIRKADVAIASSSEPEHREKNKAKPLSRKEILNKVGCQPRDRAEEAVCDGDYGALMTTLNKKGFWRSNVRKRGRTERVTALHFAALFGEVDMARALIQAGFSVNEVPFGYSTTLTPLNFAIGARQVIMVALLTMKGAVPASPDTWSTLAGQLMSRSWLMKTMSEAEKHLVPKRITEIMDILLHRGWDINAPITASGGTVLHQAVCFWTGAYKWDLSLRAAVTSFLCERGAEGKTPYDIASASEHQDLMVIIEDHSRQKRLLGTPAMPVELPGQFH